ncbi:MAG: hypothetical protein D6732_20745 [Methanobacteriota archaeon]|nr:MAG: hypothetical protein D6732_20745 [Euryarchaeota archaeon]
MNLTFDLHTHSGYAGGAGVGEKEKEKRIFKRFLDAAVFSPLKGINILGTGDCQFDPWNAFLKKHLDETDDGLFEFAISESEIVKHINEMKVDWNWKDYERPKYVLQTEIILTAPPKNGKGRKKAHALILFPTFETVDQFVLLLEKWETKHQNMARPFVVCENSEQVGERVNAILDIDEMVELIPAHVMTPEGVYGGNNGVNFLSEFFGESTERIHAIETGLSADPLILDFIPELRSKTFISNADAHSSGLNKIGREFTTIRTSRLSFGALTEAIRKNSIEFTGEFDPTEGRYFLSGHRDNRKHPYLHLKGQYCYFSPKFTPRGNICPICGKQLTKGVLNRSYEIARQQGETRELAEIATKRKFVTMVPLIEIIAFFLGIKSITSKKSKSLYYQIISHVGTEVALWILDEKQIRAMDIPERLIELIIEVKRGNFSFDPPGHDGKYGILKIGEKIDFENINVVVK